MDAYIILAAGDHHRDNDDRGDVITAYAICPEANEAVRTRKRTTTPEQKTTITLKMENNVSQIMVFYNKIRVCRCEKPITMAVLKRHPSVFFVRPQSFSIS